MKYLVFLILALPFLMGATEAPSVQSKVTYIGKVQSEIDRWGAKVQDLQANSNRAGSRSREEVDQLIKKLNDQLDVARKQLQNLRSSTESQWEKVRPGMDRAVEDVRITYRKTTHHIKLQKEK